MTLPIALVVHGHFYQPPRENPWSDELEREPSASPFHDWNQRIHAECYRANAFARIHDRGGRITSIVNNYARMSFNFGPTLARWIERHDVETHGRLAAADREQEARLGAGGGVAQAYAHPILPLATPADRRTQVLWGLADFRRRFGHAAAGLWLPETAASAATLETLIEAGIAYTILAPEQVAAVRAPKDEWTSVDRDTVDTGRAYRWYHRDGSGRYLTVAIFDGPLSRAVAFSDATRDAASFVAAVRASALKTHVKHTPLVLCASDGELFGHHKKFADLNLAFTTFVEAEKHGIGPTNLGEFLHRHPAEWEMVLAEGPDGRGTAWSCAHGVGRWWRDCGCSMGGPDAGWNQRWRTPLRQALDRLQAASADFFEDAGSQLLSDPWGARDAYGAVLDDSLASRVTLLDELATPEMARRGDRGRQQTLLLLENQRATLLMYSSCGWYFDDIAGLEAGLVMRLAAYAADLLVDAGGVAPLDEMLDLLAGAKSNQAAGENGADLFRTLARDRITPRRALAQVALGLLSGEAHETVRLEHAGHRVEISGSAAQSLAGTEVIEGSARVTHLRTDKRAELAFQVTWDPRKGFAGVVGGEKIGLADLGPESRHSLLSLLLPRIEAEGETLIAARAALDLGHGVVGAAGSPEDILSRGVFARLLTRVLSTETPLSSTASDLALELFEAAGSAMESGTAERAIAEEGLARRLASAKGVGVDAHLAHLATRLGFAPPASPEPPGTPSR